MEHGEAGLTSLEHVGALGAIQKRVKGAYRGRQGSAKLLCLAFHLPRSALIANIVTDVSRGY